MDEHRRHNGTAAGLMAVIAGSSFGLGGAVSDIINGLGYSIAQYTLVQYLVAILLFGVVYAARYRIAITLKAVVQLMLIGIAGAISSIAYYYAIAQISVGQAVALQFQYVWIVVVFQAVFDRARPKTLTIVAAALVIIGTMLGSGLVEETVSGEATMNAAGLFAALVCAVFYAVIIFANGRVAVALPAVPRSFFQSIGGLVTAIVCLPLLDFTPCDILGLLPWGILLGLLMDVIPLMGIVFASTRLSEGLVGVLTSSELPVAVIAGVVLLGETVSWIRIVGIVIICGSIVLAQVASSRARLRKQGAAAS